MASSAAAAAALGAADAPPTESESARFVALRPPLSVAQAHAFEWVIVAIACATAAACLAGALCAVPWGRVGAALRSCCCGCRRQGVMAPPPLPPPPPPQRQQFNVLWGARVAMQLLGALYVLSLTVPLQVWWAPASPMRYGGGGGGGSGREAVAAAAAAAAAVAGAPPPPRPRFPIPSVDTICRVSLGVSYGVLEPAFYLVVLFSCLYTLQRQGHNDDDDDDDDDSDFVEDDEEAAALYYAQQQQQQQQQQEGDAGGSGEEQEEEQEQEDEAGGGDGDAEDSDGEEEQGEQRGEGWRQDLEAGDGGGEGGGAIGSSSSSSTGRARARRRGAGGGDGDGAAAAAAAGRPGNRRRRRRAPLLLRHPHHPLERLSEDAPPTPHHQSLSPSVTPTALGGCGGAPNNKGGQRAAAAGGTQRQRRRQQQQQQAGGGRALRSAPSGELADADLSPLARGRGEGGGEGGAGADPARGKAGARGRGGAAAAAAAAAAALLNPPPRPPPRASSKPLAPILSGPNVLVVSLAAGLTLPVAAAQAVAALFSRVITQLRYAESAMARFFAASVPVSAACAGVELASPGPGSDRARASPADCAACAFPVFSTLVSALFALLYSLWLASAARRLGREALNARLRRRASLGLGCALPFLLCLGVALRGVSVLFFPYTLAHDATLLAYALCVCAAVAGASAVAVWLPLREAMLAEREAAAAVVVGVGGGGGGGGGTAGRRPLLLPSGGSSL